MVNQKQLEKFKKIYFEEFKIHLTDQDATQQATELLNLMKILTRPEPKEETKE